MMILTMMIRNIHYFCVICNNSRHVFTMSHFLSCSALTCSYTEYHAPMNLDAWDSVGLQARVESRARKKMTLLPAVLIIIVSIKIKHYTYLQLDLYLFIIKSLFSIKKTNNIVPSTFICLN